MTIYIRDNNGAYYERSVDYIDAGDAPMDKVVALLALPDANTFRSCLVAVATLDWQTHPPRVVPLQTWWSERWLGLEDDDSDRLLAAARALGLMR